MTSISGSAAPLPVFRFHKSDWLPKPLTPQEQLAKQRAYKRKVQLEMETFALENAKAMMERDLFQAIELEKTDPALAAKLRGRILDRGIGRVVDAGAEEVAQRRKGGNVNDLTDFLHAISAASNAVAGIAHKPATPVPGERDITPDVEHQDEIVEEPQWWDKNGGGPDHV
ncbi:hypothetical protein R6U79_12535 [Pseudomonas putida]|uniref:hypothetical protein n=1 Tax=Pseudomonas putida TaxID=303 RepID=UPI0029DE76B4|nr:hypothetical protein [Pseudomonas putida]WPK03031.1 hypothetical protein R6U79_12535 [Pseudomonas putida]